MCSLVRNHNMVLGDKGGSVNSDRLTKAVVVQSFASMVLVLVDMRIILPRHFHLSISPRGTEGFPKNRLGQRETVARCIHIQARESPRVRFDRDGISRTDRLVKGAVDTCS